jgi:hypothetical protein
MIGPSDCETDIRRQALASMGKFRGCSVWGDVYYTDAIVFRRVTKGDLIPLVKP